jgi:hypothetical protein
VQRVLAYILPAQAASINQSRRLARIGVSDPRASGDCDPKIRRHHPGEPRSNPSRAEPLRAKGMESGNLKTGLLWRFGNMVASR